MNWQWCDQAEIMRSIAARGRPRGCYEWALVRSGRDYEIYRRSGVPEGCFEWALVRPGRDYEIFRRSGMLRVGTGATRQRLWNLSPLGGARGDVMNVMKWH